MEVTNWLLSRTVCAGEGGGALWNLLMQLNFVGML